MKKVNYYLVLLLIFVVCFFELSNYMVAGQNQISDMSDCKCPEGNKFNGNECVKSSGDDACILLYNPVCGCDGQTYSNSCFANTEGIIKFTEGECRVSCLDDKDCPLGTCPNGDTYIAFSCLDGECHELNFFADPCQFSQSSSSGGVKGVKLNKKFAGSWKIKLPSCNSPLDRLKTRRKGMHCLECPLVQLLCTDGSIGITDSCKECAHCEKCSNETEVVFNLCVKDEVIEGSVTPFGVLESDGIITSQKINSRNKAELIFEDGDGNIETVTLTLKGTRILTVQFFENNEVRAKRIGSSGNCARNANF